MRIKCCWTEARQSVASPPRFGRWCKGNTGVFEALIHGSNPCRPANFAHKSEVFGSPDTVSTQDSADSPPENVKWPFKVRRRKNGPVLAKIYRPCEGRDSYRVSWSAGGKRLMRSFPRFTGRGGAREFAEKMVESLAAGSQAAALSSSEASFALAVRDALDKFRQETGRSIAPIQAVTEYLDAVRKLGDRTLAQAVTGYLSTVATVTRTDLGTAVEEFLAGQGGKTKAKQGERAQLSPTYAYMTGHFLRRFASVFPGHTVADLTKEHLDLFFTDKIRAELAPKSRNHYRNTIKQFLRWAAKKDYLPTNHRLLEAPGMEHETLTGGDTDLYRPAELQKLLEGADDILRPIIALGGLAGIRVQEALRLSWDDIFGVPGHIEISATKSKTRSRRLVEIGPALTQWLELYRGRTGAIWSGTFAAYLGRFAKLRNALGIPPRKNGLRHGFCTFHYALHGNENLTAQQAGNSPAMIHQHYKGLATKTEAEAWFNIRPRHSAELAAMPVAKSTS